MNSNRVLLVVIERGSDELDSRTHPGLGYEDLDRPLLSPVKARTSETPGFLLRAGVRCTGRTNASRRDY